MAISFNNISATQRVPLFYAEIDNSLAGSGQDAYKSLIIGQMLSAGIAAAGEPILVNSADQAKTYFGQGSMIARMVEAYRANDPDTELWCLPLEDDASAVAATGKIVIGGPATAGGTINLYVANQRIRVGVDEGDTASEIAAALAAGFGAELPVAAEVNSEDATQIDLTARHKGELGNSIDIRMNYLGFAGGEFTPAGITVTITPMASGAINPDIAEGLAALGDEGYDYFAMPYTDAANLNTWRDFMDGVTGRWAPGREIFGHGFSAKIGTVSELNTFGSARNDPHISVLGIYDTPTPPWEICAEETAACAASLSIDPARPLQTLPLRGVSAPPITSRFTRAEANTLLYSGVSTTYVEGTYVRLQRVITTYQENAWGQPDDSYLDVETMATLSYILRYLKRRITQKFGRHKLANDGTAFGSGQAIVTPNIIRAELIAGYAELEELGLVENASEFKRNLLVERDITNPNRVNILYPPDLVNQLRIFAVLAQFRLQYAQA
ncbi:phage tail sheath subtilisin-like domain-containing protein [Sneathiella sp.]|uniref:phage tail sheath subtilisin-like domain-containing protein n=1 Tax=Sneathiella sp. TaxID=1964365 RepID=UPI002FE1ABA9